jgi:hypothetical protein
VRQRSTSREHSPVRQYASHPVCRAAKALPWGHLASIRDAVLLRPADAFSLRRWHHLWSGANCPRNTRRTASKGVTIAPKAGWPAIRSRTLGSKRPELTTPTLSPKLRKVPRTSFSMACSVLRSSLRDVNSICSCWLTTVFTCTGLYSPTRIICAIPRDRADRIRHHPARPGIEDCCYIDKAGRNRDVAQIGDPELVRTIERHVVREIGKVQTVVVAVGGDDEAALAVDWLSY